MGDLYEPLSKLPKNIRQIGDRDDTVRLYIEDYVSTYLKRLFPSGGQDLRAGLLLGTERTENGVPFIFVDGALEMEDVTAEGEKVEFTEAAWKKAYQSMEESFPRRTVQGWFLCGAPGCTLSPLNYWKQHGQYFSEKNQLMYLNSGLEGEESVYVTSDDGFYRLKGYSIYYDKNQMMQDYMICRKDVRRVESGAGDRVIRDFRERMEDRKKEAVSQRHTVRNLGLLCSTMSMVILAGGVAMMNNYQKMQEMETVLVSVLPEGARPWDPDREEREESAPVIVEEIKGRIYPKTEEESNRLVGSSAGGEKGEEIVKMEPDPEKTAEIQEKQELSQETALESSAPELPAEAQPESQNSGDGLREPESQGAEFEKSESQTEDPSAESRETQADGNPKAQASEHQGSETASQETKEAAAPATDKKPGGTYAVGDGETLYGICFKLYGNVNHVEDICALNGMTDMNHVAAGQKLILPADVPVAEEMKDLVEK
ncbi:MAG: LysM peptidoglycan-binding domain-containing protein [Clostridium sp.]